MELWVGIGFAVVEAMFRRPANRTLPRFEAIISMLGMVFLIAWHSGTAEAGETPRQAPPSSSQPRTHDGLLLRFGLGVAGVGMDREGHVNVGSDDFYGGSSTIEGGASALEITVGGVWSSGIALGATLLVHQVGEPIMRRDGMETTLADPLGFAMLAATLEYFTSPTGGFHAGLSLGLAGAAVKAPQPAFTEHLGGGGGAASLLIGYSWWVSDQWSIGILGRLTGARLRGESTQLGITGSEEDELGAGSLSLQVSYN